MCCRHVLFVLWALVFLKSARFEYTVDKNSTKAMIMKDMKSAFQMLINNTKDLSRILNKMYDLSPSHLSSRFVFMVPDPDEGLTFELMQRKDFGEPIFPKIPQQQMVKMRQQRIKKIHDLYSGSTVDNAKAWSKFGLDGWTGEISASNAWLESLHKQTNNTGSTAKPSSALLGAQSYGESKQNTSAELSKNVYIARANDPFGHSIRWPLRNSTSVQHSTELLDSNDERAKRDVFDLYSMIQCSTACEPFSYKGYGCYCGFAGAGVPVDGIDRCCKRHDKCYGQSNCVSYLEYFVPYVWKCYRGKPLCALDHGHWGNRESCAARLCYCDLHLSRCLKQFVCPQRRAGCRSSAARQLQNLVFLQ